MPSDRHVTIGLGTGRCGTHSLAALLGRQPETTALHQAPPCLPWTPDYGWFRGVGDLVEEQRTARVALVGWYYLNYVDVLVRDLDARFVCLQRDREETVASIERMAPEFDNWSNRPVEDSPTARFRPLFPQFDVDTRRDALLRYWDAYYDAAERWRERYAERFVIVPTTDLNEPERVSNLLRFLGYSADEAVVDAGVREGIMAPYRWRGGS